MSRDTDVQGSAMSCHVTMTAVTDVTDVLTWDCDTRQGEGGVRTNGRDIGSCHG